MIIPGFGGFASAPAAGITLVGYADGDLLGTASCVVPLHEDAAEGDCVIVVVMGKGTDSTIGPLTGWTSLGHLVPVVDSGTGGTWCEAFRRNAISAPEAAAGSVTFPIGVSSAVSGFSIALRGGVIGASDTAAYAVSSTPRAAPTIAVDAGSWSIVIDVTGSSTTSLTSPSPADHTHLSTNTTSVSRRTAFVWIEEDETGPNNTGVTVDAGFISHGLYTIEVEVA